MSGGRDADRRPRIGAALAVAGIVLSVSSCVGAALWWTLPSWAPRFVIDHSPWLDPAIRAVTDDSLSSDQLARCERSLGDRFVPAVAPRLSSSDAHDRRLIAITLEQHWDDPRAIDALVESADRGGAESVSSLQSICEKLKPDDAPDDPRSAMRARVRARAWAAVQRWVAPPEDAASRTTAGSGSAP